MPNETSFASLASLAVSAFVLRGLGAALALGLSVAVGRLLGPAGAGLYFLAFSTVTIGAVIGRQGFDNVILRAVAASASSGDWGRVRGVVRRTVRPALAATGAMALALAILAPWVARAVFGEPELAPVLRLMSLALVGIALLTLLAEALKGLGHVAQSMSVVGIVHPAVALAVIVPLTALAGPAGAAAAVSIGTCAAVLLGALLWRRALSAHPAPPTFPEDELRRSSRPLWLTDILNRAVLPWAPLLLLGLWHPPEDVGVFGVATRIATLVTFFLTAVSTVIAPRFAALHARGEIDAMGRLARRFAAFVFAAAGPLILVLVLVPQTVMTLFGPEFARGGTALAVLALGQTVNAATGSVGYLLTMTGHERDMRTASLVGAGIMVACALTLIPPMGIIGAAIAGAAAVAGINLTSVILVRRRLGFMPVGWSPSPS